MPARHGDSAANNAKLLRELDGVPERAATRASSSACWCCCVTPTIRHRWSPKAAGTAACWRHRRGDGGFGYDPLFLPDGQTLAAAELDKALKNRISHRGQALAQLRARLTDLDD